MKKPSDKEIGEIVVFTYGVFLGIALCLYCWLLIA